MSFQAYLDNIKAKTGLGREDFIRLAAEMGFVRNGKLLPGVKAGAILDWLKTDHDLGRGHGVAIVTVLKGDQRAG